MSSSHVNGKINKKKNRNINRVHVDSNSISVTCNVAYSMSISHLIGNLYIHFLYSFIYFTTIFVLFLFYASSTASYLIVSMRWHQVLHRPNINIQL